MSRSEFFEWLNTLIDKEDITVTTIEEILDFVNDHWNMFGAYPMEEDLQMVIFGSDSQI